MAVPTVVNPPSEFDNCMQTWREASMPTVIRSEMDSGAVKVRRRFTGRRRMAEVTMTLKAEHYDAFIRWFELDCLGGVNATRIKDPRGTEQVWRITEPPEIAWIEAGAFTASMVIERAESWP